MKKFLAQSEKALYLILAVFILLMVNISSDNTAKYKLSSYENKEKSIVDLYVFRGTHLLSVENSNMDYITVFYTNQEFFADFAKTFD